MTDLSPIYRMTLNNLFDPDLTGAGHQPHGFDTLTSIYNRYRVIKCNWNINFYNATVPTRVVALPANQEVFPLGVSDACENPRAIWKVQNPGANSITLRGSTYIPSLVGRTKAQYMADDRYQAIMTQSPLELCVLNIFSAGLDDVGKGITAVITMEYVAEFFDAKNLSQS